MKIQTLEIAGFEPAIKAMRLPMKSGDKSDSRYCEHEFTPMCNHCHYAEWYEDDFACSHYENENRGCWAIGEDDYTLSMRLCKAGSDHRKHIRLIDVWAEIQAPLYWWKEFDTYRAGVDKVSESTMHTLMKKTLKNEDFEPTEQKWPGRELMSKEIAFVETMRTEGNFEAVNAMLPQSYLQTRICKISYEALRNMYQARRSHKLKEWRQFCRWAETLPYAEFITEKEVRTDEGH